MHLVEPVPDLDEQIAMRIRLYDDVVDDGETWVGEIINIIECYQDASAE
jgi:hypothetical protein